MTDPTPRTSDVHEAVMLLLPWYVTGRLDADERVQVEAHVRECPVCAAELDRERVAAPRIAAAPLDVEIGWQRLRERIVPPGATASPASGRVLPFANARRWPRFAAMAIAAQFAVIAIGIGVITHYSPTPVTPAAPYRVLGSPAPSAGGNVLLMVDGRMSSARLAELVTVGGARIVDGPTAAGAYVLAVPTAARDAAIARWKADPQVTMAEAIDP